MIGKKGAYTHKRGLDRNTNKTLLLKHIQDNASEGATLDELKQVLPGLKSRTVQWMVIQLKNEGKVWPKGKTRSARWFPVNNDSKA
jgi:ATP-dependent DNA helicase RecG